MTVVPHPGWAKMLELLIGQDVMFGLPRQCVTSADAKPSGMLAAAFFDLSNQDGFSIALSVVAAVDSLRPVG